MVPVTRSWQKKLEDVAAIVNIWMYKPSSDTEKLKYIGRGGTLQSSVPRLEMALKPHF